ncbi:MAG: GntR family transcriptional regulator [Anaerolineae bacterium]
MRPAAKASGPLYRSVAEDIVSQIELGAWRGGDKLPSERALCERYGVSQITVRRALRDLAYEGRVFSHHGLGWFVSPQGASARRVVSVSLILPELNAMTAPVLPGLAAELADAGVSLSLSFTQGKPEVESQALAAAYERGAAAVMLVVSGREQRLSERYARLLDGAPVPIVLLYHEVGGAQVPAVVLDAGHCLAQATRHLLERGHQKVAYAGGDPADVDGRRRYWGFATTLWENGLELPLDWAFAGDLTANPICERFLQVFAQPERPSALVCASDMQAAQAMMLLAVAGLRCPEDVALVGVGNRDFAAYLPTPLTTYEPDLSGFTKAAAQTVLAALDGRATPPVVISGRLVVRRSCGSRS